VAEIEKILKRRSEKVKNHCVVITFCAKPSDKWHTNASGESLVDLGFILELQVLGSGREVKMTRLFFGKVGLGGCRYSSVDQETLLLSCALPSRLAEVELHRSRGGDR